MYAQSSVAVGMKGATKAMAAMNKVACFILYFNCISCPHIPHLVGKVLIVVFHVHM